MAISTFFREPTMYGTHCINNSLTLIPGFDSNRSTCLIACLVIPPVAKANPWPMVLTANDALVITPRVAFAREQTRFACRSSPNNASMNSWVYLNSAASVPITIRIPRHVTGQTPILLANIQSFTIDHRLFPVQSAAFDSFRKDFSSLRFFYYSRLPKK